MQAVQLLTAFRVMYSIPFKCTFGCGILTGETPVKKLGINKHDPSSRTTPINTRENDRKNNNTVLYNMHNMMI